MRDNEPGDPMRAAQANMRPAPIKRFYAKAEAREADGLYALTLDGRPARTPGKRPLAARRRAVMERVADEWARQGETVDPSDMPLTRLINSAVDGVAETMEETRAEIVRYAGSDLLCYRAEAPESLAERQRAAFDPVLDWAAEALGARFALRRRDRACRAAGRGDRGRPRRRRCVRRSGGAGRAQRRHDPDRFGRAGAGGGARPPAAQASVAHRPCRRGFSDRALGRRRRGKSAARGALARDGGGGGACWGRCDGIERFRRRGGPCCDLVIRLRQCRATVGQFYLDGSRPEGQGGERQKARFKRRGERQ